MTHRARIIPNYALSRDCWHTLETKQSNWCLWFSESNYACSDLSYASTAYRPALLFKQRRRLTQILADICTRISLAIVVACTVWTVCMTFRVRTLTLKRQGLAVWDTLRACSYYTAHCPYLLPANSLSVHFGNGSASYRTAKICECVCVSRCQMYNCILATMCNNVVHSRNLTLTVRSNHLSSTFLILHYHTFKL